jgi:hypothetical protein
MKHPRFVTPPSVLPDISPSRGEIEPAALQVLFSWTVAISEVVGDG